MIEFKINPVDYLKHLDSIKFVHEVYRIEKILFELLRYSNTFSCDWKIFVPDIFKNKLDEFKELGTGSEFINTSNDQCIFCDRKDILAFTASAYCVGDEELNMDFSNGIDRELFVDIVNYFNSRIQNISSIVLKNKDILNIEDKFNMFDDRETISLLDENGDMLRDVNGEFVYKKVPSPILSNNGFVWCGINIHFNTINFPMNKCCVFLKH